MRHVIVFIEMLIGLITLVRVLRQIRTKSLVSRSMMTKIVASFCVVEVLLVFVPAISMVAFTVCWSVPLIAASLLPTIIRQQRRRHFLKHRIWVLNNLILQARLGTGLRRALIITSERADFYIKTRLRQLHDRLVTENRDNLKQTPMDPLLQEFYEVLRSCESESHLTLSQLMNYRQKIEIYEQFQRKSAQALQQLRAQAYVLCAIYIGLVFFVVSRFGFSANEQTIMFSIFLFLIGLLITLKQGRKIKWSV